MLEEISKIKSQHYYEISDKEAKSSWKKVIHYLTDMKYERDKKKLLSDKKFFKKYKQLVDITEFIK